MKWSAKQVKKYYIPKQVHKQWISLKLWIVNLKKIIWKKKLISVKDLGLERHHGKWCCLEWNQLLSDLTLRPSETEKRN